MIVAQEHTVRPAFSQRFRILFEGDACCSVAHGEKVTPETVIFEGRTSEILQSINLSKELGVSASEVAKFITIDDGEIVDVGDVIARRSVAMGTVDRIVRARMEGRIVLENISGGFAEIRAPFNDAVVKAGVHGRVGRIYPERMGRRVVDLDVNGFVSEPFFFIGVFRVRYSLSRGGILCTVPVMWMAVVRERLLWLAAHYLLRYTNLYLSMGHVG